MNEEKTNTAELNEDELDGVSGGRGYITLEGNSRRDKAWFGTLEEKTGNGRRKSRAQLTTLEDISEDGMPLPPVSKL